MKNVIWILGTITAFLIIGAGWYIISDFLEVTESKNNEIKKTATKTEKPVEEHETDSNEVRAVNLNPFGERKEISDLTDSNDYIHKMSHQKIIADTKWGFYEITDERIYWLLEGTAELELEYADVYRGILTKWADGDFLDVDNGHNTIWKLQGGTVGEATGILSEEDEARFIKSQK